MCVCFSTSCWWVLTRLYFNLHLHYPRNVCCRSAGLIVICHLMHSTILFLQFWEQFKAACKAGFIDVSFYPSVCFAGMCDRFSASPVYFVNFTSILSAFFAGHCSLSEVTFTVFFLDLYFFICSWQFVYRFIVMQTIVENVNSTDTFQSVFVWFNFVGMWLYWLDSSYCIVWQIYTKQTELPSSFYNEAILKNQTVAISLERISQYLRNLAQWS